MKTDLNEYMRRSNRAIMASMINHKGKSDFINLVGKDMVEFYNRSKFRASSNDPAIESQDRPSPPSASIS